MGKEMERVVVVDEAMVGWCIALLVVLEELG